MNVACDYEAPMQMLTTEKYIAPGDVYMIVPNGTWPNYVYMLVHDHCYTQNPSRMAAHNFAVGPTGEAW